MGFLRSCFLYPLLVILVVTDFLQNADAGLSRSQRQTILNVINNLRRRVAIGDFSEFPPSANMRVLEWDDRLEAQSRLQNGNTRCGPEQMLALSRTIPFKPYPLIGYVVALGVGEVINMTTLLNKWLMERKQYHFNITWDCADLSCKNFLQLVWADTTYVGCSHNENCDDGRLLCYFAEGSPRRIQALPYIEGAPCSRCPQNLGYCMAKSLCATQRACDDTQSQCACDLDERLCTHGVYDSDTCTCTCREGWSGARCNAPCADTRPDCYAFKDQGACRWDALEWRHMERECRSTCGYCDFSIRQDEYHTNLDEIRPNAGFPLFRVREPAPRPSIVQPVRPVEVKSTITVETPIYYEPTSTVASANDIGDSDVRTEIPWTKIFKNIDGYEQLPGNCRGGLMPVQSCVYCTIHDCAATCTRVKGCTGFSYILDENRCLLKNERCEAPEPSDRVHYYDRKLEPSAVPIPVHDDSSHASANAKLVEEEQISEEYNPESYDNKVFPAIPGYRLLAGNCPGAVVPDGGCANCTVDYCSLLCSATARCAGFSFVSQTRLCYLKWQTCDRPFPNEYTKFYQKMPGQPSFKLIDGYTLLTGYCDPVENTTTHCQPCGIDECKERCNGKTDCAGFTYYINNEKCDLLSSTCRDQITSDMQRVYIKVSPGGSTTAIPTTLSSTLFPTTITDTTTESFTTTSTSTSTTTTATTSTTSTSSTTTLTTTDTMGSTTTPAWFKPLAGYKQLAGNCFGSVIDEQGCDNCPIEECALRCSLISSCSGFTYVLATRQCLPKTESCPSPQPAEDVKFYVKEGLVTTTIAPDTTQQPTLPTWAPPPNTTASSQQPTPSTTVQQTTTLPTEPPTEATIPPASFTEVPGYHLLPGNCYGNILSEGGCVDCSALECARRCDSLPGCGGFTYIPYQLRRCIPKSGTCSNPTVNEQIRFYERVFSSTAPTTTAKPTPPPPVTDFGTPTLNDCRFSSVQLPQLSCQACSIDDCAANCLSSPVCVGFTYVVPDKTCAPVSTNCFTSSPDANIVFYPRLGVPTTTQSSITPTPGVSTTWFPTPRGYKELSGQNCWSGTIPQGECMPCSSDQCADTCSQMPNCVGFTYILAQQHCLPKSQACNLDFSNDVNLRFYQRMDGPPIVTLPPSTKPTTQSPFTASQVPVTSTVAPTTPNGPYNPKPQDDALLTTRQICYNTVAQLSCGGSQLVRIVQAHFGRISYPNEMTCGQQNPVDDGAIEAECGFFDVKPFVSALCNDKTNCSVFASDNILGNCQKLNLACPLRSLYLEVTFMCISLSDHCSVLSSEIPAGISFAASSSARMGAPAKPRATCPGSFGAQCDPSYALFTSSAMQGWCPSECDKNDGFIQLDLGAPYQINALVLQGRRRWDHWISRYYITYSANGQTWQQLESQPTAPILLDGNWDARSVVIRRFPSPSPLAAVRYLRLHIANYVGYPAVHVDVVRCPDVVGCTPLTVAHSNATGVFAVYGQSVIVQCDRRFVTPVSRLSLFSAACLPTGEWSRTEQCLLATNCGDFPRVDNALHDGQSAEIGRRLMFTCNPGYRLVGNPMVTCQASGLWSDLPSCVPTNAIV